MSTADTLPLKVFVITTSTTSIREASWLSQSLVSQELLLEARAIHAA